MSSGVTPRKSDGRYTSTEVLLAEIEVLSYAQTGHRGQHGKVPASSVTDDMLAGLAEDQVAAVTRLTTRGDLLTVLTAPAGAGKTTTIGAAAHIWAAHGYQVIGLAPSARAAAELGKATGSGADTLAKWLHHHQRHHPDLTQQPGSPDPWLLTEHTVVILDEASMASTLDLHTLTAAVFKADAKLVLVGDPAQIGVINGPGGMLPALAAAGHGIELTNIHRFAQPWEAAASLRLRAGDKKVINTYQRAGRLHTVTDPDQATGAVFAHWQTARSNGAEVMMLARTRDDVDHLNTLAKTAAQASGDSHGPELHVGHRTFQAGDVIRTRRNQRSIGVGDSHVRNGDRYTILATTEGGALLVDDLAGRGATLLPPGYVTEHVEHGWATTIDTAQGATTDHAVLLVRPGIDREHLYVGLTRGREQNHAYVTTAPDTDDNHPKRPDSTASTRDILTAALTRTGQQDAAHTLLERARDGSPSGPTASPAAAEWAPAHSTSTAYRISGASTRRTGPSR